MQGLSDQKMDESAARSEKLPSSRAPIPFVALILIGLVTVAAYAPVMADFFHGDDYIHLTWLPKAVAQPDLIWRNFYTSWLDGFYAQFYRPLISVFNVFDYVVWRGNGFGFHVTNLVAHLVTTLFLFLIVRGLCRAALIKKSDISAALDRGDEKFLTSDYFALGAAALFAFYPVHPEAVSWITGRVDSICAMFTLGSFWCFMEWRGRKKIALLFVSLLLFALGLLSKEMAVTLPAVLVIYLLLFPEVAPAPSADVVSLGSAREPPAGSPRESPYETSLGFVAREAAGEPSAASLWERPYKTGLAFVARALVGTVPFWIVWVEYFVVRHHALGTIIGGYDNAMFFIPDWMAFFSRWAMALGNFVVPINHGVVDQNSWEVVTWRLLLAGALSSATFFCVRSWAMARIGLFSCGWMVLSLLPVIKCLYVHDDLEGARMVYLASAPLCALIMLGASRLFYEGKSGEYLSIGAIAGLLFISDLFLVANNRPWYEAGMETRAIESGLKHVYKNDPNIDRLCYFAGIPNAVNGAYVGCNAFDGMSKVPRMDHDLKNCFGFSPIDRIFPYGFAKGKLPNMLGYTHVYRWNSVANQFELVVFPGLDNVTHEWLANRALIGAKHVDGQSIGVLASNSSEREGNPFEEIELSSPGIDCWNTDVLQFTVNVDQIGAEDKFRILKLRYQNDLQHIFDEETEEFNTLAPKTGEQKIIFPLRGNANWWLGGYCKRMRLEFPRGWKAEVVEVKTLDSDKLIPRVDFVDKSRAFNLGPIVLKADYRICPIAFDVSQIKDAKSAVLDMTLPNMFFDTHNSPSPNSVIGKQIPLSSVRGQFNISSGEFAAPGIYEFRVRAVDKNGATVGLSSDHLAVFLPQLLK